MIDNVEAVLRRLQLTELEILKVVDKVCRDNKIDYSLYAGTLLGAVRHKGFIPWDDDLDICLTRENYNRFIKIWNANPPKGYILQNKENTPDFSQTFTKIRKDNTAFFQEGRGDAAGSYHKGIFIDVFPVDRMPNGKMARLLFAWRCMRYQLFTREYVPIKSGGFVRVVSEIMLKCTPPSMRKKTRENLLKKITSYNRDTSLHMVTTEVKATVTLPLPPDLMDEYMDIEFEGCLFRCNKKWDDALRLKFGDYMQLPPKEERTWRHYPVALDFEHNYEDIQ